MSAPIWGFVGANGGGKSLAAMELAVIPAVEAGHVIVGNVRMQVPDFKLLRSWRELIRVGVHEEYGYPARLGPRGERLTVLDDGYHDGLPEYSLTRNRPALVVLDEIQACLPSRSFASMPVQLQRVLNQLRKQDTMVAWTAPNWARADVLLREVTQHVTVCRGYLPDRWVRVPAPAVWPKVARDDAGERLRHEGAWRPARLFRWTTYDAINFEEFTANDQEKIRPLTKRLYWRPVHRAQFIYNTQEAVQLMDHLDDLGNCMGCGGKRPQPKCTCSVYEMAASPTPKARGAATNGASR